MSRRRRPDDSEDALDLFLDAISNVFGGILFIALAVVVLLQFTTATPVTADSAEHDDSPMAENLEQINKEIGLLESLLQGASPQDQTEVQQYRALQAEMEIARLEVVRLREQEQQSQAQQQAQRLSVDALQERVASLERELLDAQQSLENALKVPPDRQRVGRFRDTGKREVPVMLKDGRLVEVLRFMGEADSPVLNSDALRINKTEQHAEPKPGKGMALTGGPQADAAYTALLARFDPEQDYLSIAVWPDAFAQAIRLRDTAIEMGFDFALTPIPEGRGVPFKAASGVQ